MIPGIEHFSEATRRAVADGPLFDRRHAVIGHGRAMLINSDRECVVLALTRIQPAPDSVRPPGLNDVLRLLSWRNDRGDYADRANLYADLLGEDAGTAARAGEAGED